MAFVLLQQTKKLSNTILRGPAMRHTSRFNLCKGYLAISKLSVHQNASGQELENAPKASFAEFQVVYAELLLKPLWLNFTQLSLRP